MIERQGRGENPKVRLASSVAGVPTAQFTVGSDGKITPTIGTAGTYLRSGAIFYPNGANTVAEETSNDTALEDCIPNDINQPGTARTGFMVPPGTRNECQQTRSFDSWTTIGTVTVTAAQADGPDGSTNSADQIAGSASGDGIQLTLVQNATDYDGAWMTFQVWMKTTSGTADVRLRVKDSGGNYWTTPKPGDSTWDTVTVDTTWKPHVTYGRTPVPGDTSLIAEIIVDSGTVLADLAMLEFAGLSPVWDSNVLGGWLPVFNDAGASRTVTEESSLLFSGSEINTSLSAFTICGWYYIPDKVSLTHNGADRYLWHLGETTPTTQAAIWCQNSDSKMQLTLPDGSTVSTNINLEMIARSRWVHVAASCTSGDNKLYINGVKMFTDTTAWSAFTPDHFGPGMKTSSNSGDDGNRQFMYIMGEQSFWASQLTDAQVSQHYTDTASTDAEPDNTSYLADTASATEIWTLSHAPGNLVSDIGGVTYATADQPFHYTRGPQGLRGVNFQNTGSHFTQATLGSELNIGATDDFVIVFQFRHSNEAPDTNHYLFDFGWNNAARAGIAVWLNSARLDVGLYDDSANSHQSRWTHGGIMWQEDALYTVRIVYNRSNTAGRLYYKKEGESESSEQTMTSVLTAFTSFDAISPAGGIGRIGAPGHTNATNFWGDIYQIALSVGNTTYDFTTKP